MEIYEAFDFIKWTEMRNIFKSMETRKHLIYPRQLHRRQLSIILRIQRRKRSETKLSPFITIIKHIHGICYETNVK